MNSGVVAEKYNYQVLHLLEFCDIRGHSLDLYMYAYMLYNCVNTRAYLLDVLHVLCFV